MRTLLWSQLRFGRARLVALLAGILVATTAFTVLTAASRTSQLRTVGTVSAHFVPAYDILVRPAGARTRLEQQTGSVQPNFLAGIYGGISTAQWRQIQHVPGVSVAAPVAMAGYTLLVAPFGWSLPSAQFSRPERQLYRITSTWVSERGTSRVTQPSSYAYVTPRSVHVTNTGQTVENLPGGHQARVCGSDLPGATDPFGVADQSSTTCWSKVNKSGLGPCRCSLPSNPGWGPNWVIPVLIAAVDPVSEAKLDHLGSAVVSGRYLPENASDSAPHAGTAGFPVLAASTSGVDEYALTRLEALPSPSAPPDMTTGWLTREARVPGRTLATERTTAQQAYRELLGLLARRSGARAAVSGYWSASPVRYQRPAGGGLVPVRVGNPPSVWYTLGQPASMDDADYQYRSLAVHAPRSNGYTGVLASPQLVGVFDPAKITSFDPLSQVPLGPYQPTLASPANQASRTALHGGNLLPNQNVGGLVTQPVDLITSLSALPALQNTGYYGPNLPISDPISVVRVRVAGVTGPDAVSLARIREVAQQITQRTHLDVDIVDGSSPAPRLIDLPAGRFGQPALALTENWVKKGVALAILSEVDKSSLVLFTLILIVCVLFVANSAVAAIRARRRDLGVLACLGWTRPRIFAAVLGEVAATGLAAGILGGAVALPLSSAIGLRASPGRATLAVPVAVAVALVAGLVPAWLAARAEPVAAVRPAVAGVRRARHPAGVTSLAVANLLRTPGRTLVGAVSLAAGIGALTVLAAMTVAFRGVLVGSLLGNAVSVQVRGVDYVSVVATIVLGVLAVADVMALNVTERSAELAALRSFGWPERALGRLVVTEGALIGLSGSLAGASVGLAAAAKFAGQAPVALYPVAVAAVIAGALVTAAAALLPAQMLRRLPAAQLLARE